MANGITGGGCRELRSVVVHNCGLLSDARLPQASAWGCRVDRIVNVSRKPNPQGLLVPRCGVAEHMTTKQVFRDNTEHIKLTCARCNKFLRYLKQEDAPDFKYEPAPPTTHKSNSKPPPQSWDWLGLIRLSDGKWRAVALAPS